MPALTTTPAFAPSQREVEIVFTPNLGGNFVRVWCVDAPDGTSLKKSLISNATSRFKVYEGRGGVNDPWRATFEKGGQFLLIAQEYTKGQNFGGGYKNDPDGYVVETQVGAETSLTLTIGQRATMKIGVDSDTATLTFWVWGDTIRATDVHTYGDVTPKISNDNATPKARIAMNATTVQNALLALVGLNVVSEQTTVPLICGSLSQVFGYTHAQNPTVHANADSDNETLPEMWTPPSPKELAQAVSILLLRMRRHFTNDKGTGIGSASSPYHRPGSFGVSDYTDMPLFRSVSSAEDAYGALADCWRAFEGHRLNTSVHNVPDTAAPMGLTPLLEVHRQFLAVLAATSPAVPPTQTTGMSSLISVGFKES